MGINVAASEQTVPPPALIIGNPYRDASLEAALKKEGFSPLFPRGQVRSLEQLEQVLTDFRRGNASSTLAFVHPGTGPLAGRPETYHLCQKLSLSLISPSAKILSLFSNRLNLLNEAQTLEIPNLVLDFEPIHSYSEAERLLRNNYHRVVLKSMQRAGHFLVVEREQDLKTKFPLWLEQLRASSTEAIFYAERYLGEAKRVLLPFCRNGASPTLFLPTVDISLQISSFGRHRRLLDICPSPHLQPETEKLMQELAERLLAKTHFVGLGSLEFLLEGNQAYLLEGQAQLDSSHTLWEEITGSSAVQLQLDCLGYSSHKPYSISRSQDISTAIHIRAEDPVYQLPRPGRIHKVDYPKNREGFDRTHARIYYQGGQSVDSSQNGEIGLIEARGPHLEDCFNQLLAFAGKIWIAGELQTNIRYLLSLLKHPWIREGIFHASFLDEEFVPEYRNDLDLIQTLVQAAGKALPTGSSGRWSLGGRLVVHQDLQSIHTGKLKIWQDTQGLKGLEGLIHFPRLGLEGIPLLLFPIAQDRWVLTTPVFSGLARFIPDQENTSHLGLIAQVAGKVHSLLFQEGKPVPPHEPLLLIESLGNLVPHSLPVTSSVEQWLVKAGQEVNLGEKLAQFKKV